jgi:putative tryptophan/tyrosine transport system substrate-binding protein
MRGPSVRAWIRGVAFLTALVCAMGVPGAPKAPAGRVAVLISQDAEPYQEALAGIRQYVEKQKDGVAIDVFALGGDAARAAEALGRARQAGASLIFTLGSVATQSAVRQAPDTPIVACMILTQADLGKVGNATAVVLEFPPETEFRWLKRMLPGAKNVGVVYNPAENQARVDEATATAASVGLTLHARPVASPREIPQALESLASEVDVLWGLADSMVLNTQTAQSVLLFSLRNKIPFVGLSQPWAKAGALYALDRDYRDIGLQCAEVGYKILQGNEPRAIPPSPPRKVVYSVNVRTANLLKLSLTDGVVKEAQSVFR